MFLLLFAGDDNACATHYFVSIGLIQNACQKYLHHAHSVQHAAHSLGIRAGFYPLQLVEKKNAMYLTFFHSLITIFMDTEAKGRKE